MLQYNDFVEEAFANPRFVLEMQTPDENLILSQAGERPRGVWFKLAFDTQSRKLFYKVYGSPYVIAAVEYLAREVAQGNLSLGEELPLEQMRQALDMPYPYMHSLLTLEDAWNGLQGVDNLGK